MTSGDAVPRLDLTDSNGHASVGFFGTVNSICRTASGRTIDRFARQRGLHFARGIWRRPGGTAGNPGQRPLVVEVLIRPALE
jgi:hypothetical protein